MQLNTLTLNSSPSPYHSSSYLAIYDHSLTMVNSQVFVYGKNTQNFTIQTPLHKINLTSLKVEPVFTVNAPALSQLMMFSFEQHIYLLGKSPLSQETQLFEFDGLKFTKIDHTGPAPTLQDSFSSANFSHGYLLLFNCQNSIEFLNKWYFFDIKLRQWKLIVSPVQIPVCQKSHLIWKNGRGYLLMQNCYNKFTKTYHPNLFFEIKFKNNTIPCLQITQIPLSCDMRGLSVVFTHLFSFDDMRLMILGGEQILASSKKGQNQNQISVKGHDRQIDFKNTKIIFEFDLETFQWTNQAKIIPIKGQNFEILSFDKKLIITGGTQGNELIKEIQFFDLKTLEQRRKFPYEQSLCYYCQCAFTYQQKLTYAPAVQREYETFAPKSRVENKFLKKISQQIKNELHAIGTLCEYLMKQTNSQIQINLCQEINLHPKQKLVKNRIEAETSEILSAKSFTDQSPSLTQLIEAFTGQKQSQKSFQFQDFSVNLTKVRLASYKLGYGLLYVTSTEEGFTFVSYSSFSQTQFPESNFKSFSDVFYTVKWNSIKKVYEYSSENKRNIIFQNVKMHFGSPQSYEKNGEPKKKKATHFVNMYIIGVTNLERAFHIELSKNQYLEDLKIKSLNRKNPTNSLRKYLKHLYLFQNSEVKLKLQNADVEFLDVYQKFEELVKAMEIKEIPTNDEACHKKAQNEETHFSTNQDDVISWKKIDIIENCRLYEASKSNFKTLGSIYNCVFIYHEKKLLRTIETKNSTVCGVIELIQSVQIQLNGSNFSNRSDERRLLKWIEQIENSILEQSIPSAEEL